MPDDGDAKPGGLTEEHHSWITEFFGISLKAAAAVGDAATSAASAVGQVASGAASSVLSTVEQVSGEAKQAVTSGTGEAVKPSASAAPNSQQEARPPYPRKTK